MTPATADGELVITGIGMVTPVGGDARTTMDALQRGRSGVRLVPEEQRSRTPVHLHAPVDDGTLTRISGTEARRMDRSVLLALQAAREAWADAGRPRADPGRLASVIATGMGGVRTMIGAHAQYLRSGYIGIPVLTIPAVMPNAAAAAVAMEVGAHAGAITTVSACASGADAIALTASLFREDEIDVAVVGGTEAVTSPELLCLCAALRALSARHDDPAGASRPFDRDRDGFVLGDGAGVLVVERRRDAAARGARIWATLLGAGRTCDAYHIVAPDPEGTWAGEAARKALRSAGAAPADVSFVSAHATGTPVGDLAEYRALRKVFGTALPGVPVTAVKSALGHLIGGSGAVAAATAAMSLHDEVIPPTLNLENLDPQIDLDVVCGKPRYLNGARAALVNSFGFGGHNVALLLGAP
jgi:3-oxoacyl-[acyl-carrier-protein] synthase II